MRLTARPTDHAAPRSGSDVHKWLDLALLVASGAAIMGVVVWLQNALSG